MASKTIENTAANRQVGRYVDSSHASYTHASASRIQTISPIAAIHRLPDDVLLEIFLAYQEVAKGQDVFTHMPDWRRCYAWVEGLTRVCRRWRILALNFAWLWTEIGINGVGPDVVSLFLQRSRELPLNILMKYPHYVTRTPAKHTSRLMSEWAARLVSIYTGKKSSSQMPIHLIPSPLDTVLTHAHRIRSIDVFVPQPSRGHILASRARSRLQFPQLISLRLRNFDWLVCYEDFLPAFLGNVENLPQLCSLEVVGFRWLQAKQLFSRNLSRLSIQVVHAGVAMCAEFLDALEGLPLLEILDADCSIALGLWAAHFATSPYDLSPYTFRSPVILPRLRAFSLGSGVLTTSVILDHLTLPSIHCLNVTPTNWTRNAELLSSAHDDFWPDSSPYSTDELCLVIASGLRHLLQEKDQLPLVNALIVHLQPSGSLHRIHALFSSRSSPPSLNTNSQCQESLPQLMTSLGEHQTLRMLRLLPALMPLESLQSLTIGTAIPTEKPIEGREIAHLLSALCPQTSIRSLSFARAAVKHLSTFLDPTKFEQPFSTFPGLRELTIRWEENIQCWDNDWREEEWVSKLTEALKRRSDAGFRLELLCLFVRQPISSAGNLEVVTRLRDCVTKLELNEWPIF